MMDKRGGTFQRPLVMILFLASLLLPYMLYYSNRNIITAVIPYLVDQNVLTQNTFVWMQTCSYGTMILAKFGMGLLLTAITHNLFHRTALFGGAISLVSLSLVIISVCTMLGVRDQSLACVFVICFATIKLLSSVIRPLLLSIIHAAISDRMYGLPADDSVHAKRFLGWMSSILQCLSCIGDVIGKVTFAGLITDNRFLQWAQRCKQPSWTLAFITLGSMSLLSAFTPVIGLTSFIRKTDNRDIENKHRRTTIETNWRTLIKSLFSNTRLLLLLACNTLSGFCSVASGSYAVHFYRFALGFDSIYVTRLDSISPICIAAGIMTLTFIIQRFMPTARKLIFLLAIVAVVDAILLYVLKSVLNDRSISSLADHTTSIITMFILHQVLYFSYAAILDGLAVTYLLPNAYIAPTTGIVSSFSYLGGFTAPFVLYRWVSSLEGWRIIFGVVSWLLLANVSLLTLISIILYNRRIITH